MKYLKPVIGIIFIELVSLPVSADKFSAGGLQGRKSIKTEQVNSLSAATQPANRQVLKGSGTKAGLDAASRKDRLPRAGRLAAGLPGRQPEAGRTTVGDKSLFQGRAGRHTAVSPITGLVSGRRQAEPRGLPGRNATSSTTGGVTGFVAQRPEAPGMPDNRQSAGGIPVVNETRQGRSGPLMSSTDKTQPVIAGRSNPGVWVEADQGKKMGDGGTLYADGTRTDSHGNMQRHGLPAGSSYGENRHFEDKHGNMVMAGAGMLVQQQKGPEDRTMITDPRTGVTVRFGAQPVEAGSSVGKGPEKKEADSDSSKDESQDSSDESQGSDEDTDGSDEDSSDESSDTTEDDNSEDSSAETDPDDEGGESGGEYRGEGGGGSSDAVNNWLESLALAKRLMSADEDRPVSGPGCGPTGQPGSTEKGCADSGATEGDYMNTGSAMVDTGVIFVVPTGSGDGGHGPECFDPEGCEDRPAQRGMQTRMDDSHVVNPGGEN